ncbi:protein of unknown function [Caballeronia sp. S22]
MMRVRKCNSAARGGSSKKFPNAPMAAFARGFRGKSGMQAQLVEFMANRLMHVASGNKTSQFLRMRRNFARIRRFS